MVNAARRPTKNEKRRLRQKAQGDDVDSMEIDKQQSAKSADDKSGVVVEYISSRPAVGSESEGLDGDDIMAQFQAVFEKFATPEELTSSGLKVASHAAEEEEEGPAQEDEEEDEDGPKGLSKKKKKLASRLSVAELKQLVQRPDVVEAHDVTSSDPRLLVFLKAYRNTVPVPRHWCHKRKYLQGKRGIEKAPFQLPEFIADTGIAKIRESVLEQEALKKSKQKARDRMQPKMGKIDIDYQVLHDAFFKYQTKPKMTGHGDLYYEGKEYEVDLKEKKPGFISEDLRQALGMTGVIPPPWLINMQRYGPPPAYPSLKIPGLSAPLPEGASFGYHPGGWGKPPVDEHGQPLYGDVFGAAAGREDGFDIVIDRTRWGEFEEAAIEDASDEEASDEEASEGSVEEQEEISTSGMETPMTFDGTSSMISGMETPDAIDLRKRAGQETPGGDTPRELYHVVQERAVDVSGSGQIFGSDKVYSLPGAEKAGDVSASTPVEEGGESVGKRKRRPDGGSSAAKRQKDFKF
jgi:splicing factor 3B subunit 2